MLTNHGTALVTAWEHAEADLRPFGGPSNGVVVNGIVQELELPSGRVLFEWKSMDHVSLAESYAGVGDQFDYFHINSIERLVDGDYLVSARNTWCIYKIDGRSGKSCGASAASAARLRDGCRHGVRLAARCTPAPGQLAPVFRRRWRPSGAAAVEGLVLALDVKRKRAVLHRRYTHYPTLHAQALGSMQRQPNGNVLVGWGTAPYFTEYTDEGRVVFDARLPKGGQNYRTLRFRGAEAALSAGGQSDQARRPDTCCVSWNAAQPR